MMTERCPCRQSHDITFCTGERCKKKETCHRFRLNHVFGPKSYISIANFADHNGDCRDHYWPKDFKSPVSLELPETETKE